MSGTFWVFLAEALILPTGLVTAGILTRQLGPEGYGILTLVAVLVSWIEWTITSIFSRTAIKFVSDAEDWQPVGTVIAQLHVGIGAIAMLGLWLFAQPIATLLDIPTLVPYLQLFAIDIPIFCLAHAHRQLLIGRGLFQQRAIASAGRWIARLAIIALLVEYANWSIEGAILGSLGASVVELALGRWFVRPPLLKKSTFAPQKLFGYALPLFLCAMGLRLFDKLDLFMLKILGGTVEQAGVYGAAQNLAFIPSIFALSFSPLLLSTLNRKLRSGDPEAFKQAKQIAQNAVRTVIALIPFAALAAAAAVPIVTVVYGQAFAVAGPVLAVLLFGAMALLLLSVITAILTAAGRPNLTAVLVAPMLPLSAVGYVAFVPQYGAMAACWVNMGASVMGAMAALGTIYHIWRISPKVMTVVRSAIACGIIYTLGIGWITPDPSLVIKILALSCLIPLIFLALGELSPPERQFVSRFISQQPWLKAIRKKRLKQ
ncbi:MAG: oligosaccharide flippase family protein [Cyanobacteria bacterium P01_D01_bin.105]